MVRKPFAIRDYPPGIGRNTARIHVTPREGTAKVVLFEKDGEVNPRYSKFLSSTPIETTEKMLMGPKLSPYVKTASSSGYSQKAATRRFISAIRDYPPFCGPNSLSLSKGDVSKGKLMDRHLSGATEEKKRKLDCLTGGDGSKAVLRTKDSLNHSKIKVLKKKEGHAAPGGMATLAVLGKNCLDNNYGRKFSDGHRSYGVNVPLLHRRNLSIRNNDATVTRNTVRETLRLFQALCRKLLQKLEAESKGQAKVRKRVDSDAAKILRYEGKYVNAGKQIFGPVPGVEVGDEFDYRVELNIVGLHRQTQAGIDFAKINGEHLATSIVASGGYHDELDNSGVLIYSGQGGNVMCSKKQPEDQKLERGNLALKNSSKKKNPVRVIRGAFFEDGNRRRFVYDGLYEVEAYWQEMGPHGKMVFKFQLRRIPNQPELPWIELKKSNMFTLKKGQCAVDISHGKEELPIRAVNTIDNEKPPSFEYITRMIYPNWLHLTPAKGCNCTDRCSDPTRCSCAVKNGGIPFNHTGCIVEVKPLVYECGPSCKCPPDCYNRVSQRGIKFPLEVYKTDKRGWGVRSLRSIPSGSFVCEYIGELLEDKVAEQRTGHDEYLFDIVSEDGSGFTIDAARCGNLGRFFNHSCAPNMYAQNVLFDHGDCRIPHIMLFAAENIPPLKELTYDYNYSKDQIFDSDGNIKKKDCFCGSLGCTGRMY
ncbi:histone-lysine N-methyltransferase, H3 lysine-9 specific SUVH6-like [Neltuma alba]|uniref:histone-lysine N-methyltransferase, H3 lysine-9 specific SUVH6-like n=1 Tax=Neltuma alba TaxID=207710 RepID=UPI0010A582D3|nr:histone-lysine N-methyltransferase, H3 lysine-9 specific SUVH6-like [Prosopis alba]